MGQNVIQRKITIAAERLAKASLQNSLVQDIEHATAKVFLNMLHTEVTAVVVNSEINSHTSTIENMSSTLFGILEIGEDIGLAGFDDQFVNAAVAILTGAATLTSETVRVATRTDAALARSLINTILTEIFQCASIEGMPDGAVQMGSHETDKAPLVFLMQKRRYALLRVSISGPNATRFGDFELVLPLSCVEKFAAVDASLSPEIVHDNWAQQMNAAAINTPLEATAIVQRIKVPLSEILNMKTGEMLELTEGSLTNLTFEVDTAKGSHVVMKGQLGALKTHKAFRVTRTSNDIYGWPEFS